AGRPRVEPAFAPAQRPPALAQHLEVLRVERSSDARLHHGCPSRGHRGAPAHRLRLEEIEATASTKISARDSRTGLRARVEPPRRRERQGWWVNEGVPLASAHQTTLASLAPW